MWFKIEWRALSEAMARSVKVLFLPAIVIGVLGAVPGAARAESATPPPEKYRLLGPGNVDVTSGQFSVTFNDLSMPPEMGLSIERSYSSGTPSGWAYAPLGMGMTHSYNVYQICTPCGPANDDNYTTVIVGDKVHSFVVWGELNESNEGDGAVIEHVNGETHFRDSDGTLIYFDGGSCGVPSEGFGACTLASKIVRPNGQKILFEYELGSTATDYAQSRISRLKRAYNPNGYGLEFSYLSPDTSAGVVDTRRHIITKIQAYHAACGSGVCDNAALPSIEYSYDLAQSFGDGRYEYRMTGFKDVNGQTSTYGYANGPLTSARLPANPQVDQFFNTYNAAGKVISTRDARGTVRNYTYTDNPNQKTYTVVMSQVGAGSINYVHVYDTTWAAVSDRSRPRYVYDQLSRKTTNVYDDLLRPLEVTYPEGNNAASTYGARGNLTELRIKAKPGTGAPDLVTTWTYPATCVLANSKICNKPTYMIDPRGGRTDYEYSLDHGEPLTVTGPADADGVRPVTTYGYTPVTTASGVFYLRTSKTEKISSAASVITTYGYDAANKYVLKEKVVDSGGANLRTCYGHDAAGNLISKTDPNAGLAVCP